MEIFGSNASKWVFGSNASSWVFGSNTSHWFSGSKDYSGEREVDVKESTTTTRANTAQVDAKDSTTTKADSALLDSKQKEDVKDSTTTKANKEVDVKDSTTTKANSTLLDSKQKEIICHLLSSQKACQDVSPSTKTAGSAPTPLSILGMAPHTDNPPTNIKVDKDKYELVINMPGFSSFEKKLEKDENNKTQLVITGTRSTSTEAKGGTYVKMDHSRRVGEIEARYGLPPDADLEEIIMSNWKGLVTVSIERLGPRGRQLRVHGL